MTTVHPLPPPTAPTRGEVQKTWVDRLILAGFMDDNHFQMVAGEYLASLTPAEKTELLTKVAAARSYVAGVPPEDLSSVEISPILPQLVSSFLTDNKFIEAFQERQWRFAYVRADKLIALQTTVNPRHDAVPSDASELMNYCLPHVWEVPAEISFIQPQGPILITSSSPMMQGIKLEWDPSGKVSMSPAPHMNLLNVREFAGRYYLFNGYHRTFDLLANGVKDVPAIVTTALGPQDIQMPGGGFFNPLFFINSPRPPLVKDFLSQAAIKTQVRERRHGVTISLDFKPFNIGI